MPLILVYYQLSKPFHLVPFSSDKEITRVNKMFLMLVCYQLSKTFHLGPFSSLLELNGIKQNGFDISLLSVIKTISFGSIQFQ
jgi:hypothetical protein